MLSNTDVQRLLREYTYYRDHGRLAELASEIGVAKTYLCAQAGLLGLTNKRSSHLWAQKLGPDNPQWKGDEATPGTGNKRCRQTFSLGQCVLCDNSAVDRHHIDGNSLNNEPSNVMILCRHHHMKIDGRLKQLPQYPRPSPDPVTCINCGGPAIPPRKGLCPPCSQYLWLHDVHRPVKYISDTEVERKCSMCRQKFITGRREHKEYCPECKESWTRAYHADTERKRRKRAKGSVPA